MCRVTLRRTIPAPPTKYFSASCLITCHWWTFDRAKAIWFYISAFTFHLLSPSLSRENQAGKEGNTRNHWTPVVTLTRLKFLTCNINFRCSFSPTEKNELKTAEYYKFGIINYRLNTSGQEAMCLLQLWFCVGFWALCQRISTGSSGMCPCLSIHPHIVSAGGGELP